MKYIDAEKLKAEIQRRGLSNRYIDTEDYEVELYEIIDSLKQEQPECIFGNIPSEENCKYCGVTCGSRVPKELVSTSTEIASYDEAYLNECIAKASKSWKGVNVDKFMDEMRGREQGQTKEGIVCDNNEFIKFHDGSYIDLCPNLNKTAFDVKDGDEVIVNISRKSNG